MDYKHKILGLYACLCILDLLLDIENDRYSPNSSNKISMDCSMYAWMTSMKFIKTIFPDMHIIFIRDIVEDKIVDAIICYKNGGKQYTVSDFIDELEKRYDYLVSKGG